MLFGGKFPGILFVSNTLHDFLLDTEKGKYTELGCNVNHYKADIFQGGP